MPTLTPELRGDDEVDAISPAVFNGVGVVALFAWLFYMVSRGALVTRREHDAVKEDRDYWRAIAMKTTSTAEKMAEQKSVSIAAVESIARQASETGGAG